MSVLEVIAKWHRESKNQDEQFMEFPALIIYEDGSFSVANEDYSQRKIDNVKCSSIEGDKVVFKDKSVFRCSIDGDFDEFYAVMKGCAMQPDSCLSEEEFRIITTKALNCSDPEVRGLIISWQ